MDTFLHDLSIPDFKKQSEAFSSILRIIQTVGNERFMKDGGTVKEDASFPNDILFSLTSHIMDMKASPESLVIDTLFRKAINRFIDVKFYSYRNLNKIIASTKSPEIASRIFELLLGVRFPSADTICSMQKLVKLPEGCPVHYHNIQHLRSQFSNLWMSIIPILPHLKLKKLLLFLNDNILPYMQEPEILITFLTDAYKSGGVCGILALDSLFCLMRNFNINVPDFYDHLYALLDEKILTSPYREMFLRSFSLFMTSTMLPAYVVAAMIKKLSRLLLAAPPNAIVWVIPFIYNMMKRYPACRIMIHRENENIQVDPYKFYATSISDCNALESCLWEILALENHYWHRIARLPKIFREKFTKPEYNLEDILDGLEAASSIDGVKDELSHRWSKKPPITLEVPNIAFY